MALGNWIEKPDRKFKVVGDHIEPSFASVTFKNERELLDAMEGDLLAALENMGFEGEAVTLTVTLVKMTDEEHAALPHYDP